MLFKSSCTTNEIERQAGDFRGIRMASVGARRATVGRWAFIALTLAVLVAPLGCRKATDLGPIANVAAAASVHQSLTAGSADAAEGEEGSAVGTGWATLKGRFIYDGDPPQMPLYPVNKDEATCAPGGAAPPQEYLLVDGSSKGIANVAIYLRKASRVHESAQPSSESVVFDQKACVFLTHVMAVTAGQPLELKNSDNVGHNTSVSGQNVFNQTIPAGETVAYVPKKEEGAPVAVRCSIHPWMLSYLLPRGNRYVAVTAGDGSFEIANLPAGEKLEMQVWHEKAAGANNALFVDSPDAKELKWSKKGRFEIQLAENENRELNVAVPPLAFAAE